MPSKAVENAHPPVLTHFERAAAAVAAVLEVALCGLAAVLIVSGLSQNADPDSPHGRAFAFLGALLLGPPGALFLLAAVGIARRWWLHALPALAVLGLFAVLGLGIPICR